MIGIFIGLVTGLLLGGTGAGGAIIAIPLLVYLAGLPLHSASGLALAIVAVGALFKSSCWMVSGKQALNWRLIAGLTFTAMLVAPIGRWVSFITPEWFLVGSFSVLMILVAIKLWFSPQCSKKASVSSKTLSSAQTMGGGIAVGFLSGLFGIGGGLIVVPLLRFLGLGMTDGIRHSIAVVGLVSTSGFVSHLLITPSLPISLLLSTIVGVIAGISLGSCIVERINVQLLQRVFAVVLLIAVGTSCYKLAI